MSKIAIGADDKKKLIAFGGLVIAVILVIVFLFVFNKKPETTSVAESTPSANIPPADVRVASPEGSNAPVPAGSTSGKGGITALSLASLSGSPADPFTPEYLLPPPPPVPLPQPVVLPSPQGTYAGLPPAYVAGNNPSNVMMGLPPIMLPRQTHPVSAPRQFEAPKQMGGNQIASPSFNKRLSGVIIGDSVHALLEVSNASGTRTYVVQPGDTIAGIQILSIQRVEVGGKTVPRILISENGEQKYVELRSSFSPQTDVQAGGMEDFEGPGVFPDDPTIFPQQSINPGQQMGRGVNPFSAN